MFGKTTVKIDTHLWEKICKYSALAGYSSPTEFLTHALEKELSQLEEADSDEKIKEKLKGLGYIS
jgi:hypothetical protein